MRVFCSSCSSFSCHARRGAVSGASWAALSAVLAREHGAYLEEFRGKGRTVRSLLALGNGLTEKREAEVVRGDGKVGRRV